MYTSEEGDSIIFSITSTRTESSGVGVSTGKLSIRRAPTIAVPVCKPWIKIRSPLEPRDSRSYNITSNIHLYSTVHTQ